MQLHTIMHENGNGNPQRTEFYSEEDGTIYNGMIVFVNEAKATSLSIPQARVIYIESVLLDEA